MDTRRTPAPADSAALLHRNGLKATGPRMAVLDLLRDDRGHLTVEEVCRLVRNGRPRTSVATVYRVLEDLSTGGLIRTLRLGRDRVYYEYRIALHRHAICRRCGVIRDVEPVNDCLEACVGEAAASGFHFDGVDVVFLGTCPACLDGAGGVGRRTAGRA